MERRFLIISLFFLFQLSSCQSNSTVTNNFALEEITIPIEEQAPIADNVWDYMIIKSNYDDDINLDEKTLNYINNHIKDVEKFNKFLNRSYYFIYYVIQELEAARSSSELALIPFVESNYDPFHIPIWSSWSLAIYAKNWKNV